MFKSWWDRGGGDAESLREELLTGLRITYWEVGGRLQGARGPDVGRGNRREGRQDGCDTGLDVGPVLCGFGFWKDREFPPEASGFSFKLGKRSSIENSELGREF